MKTIKFKSKGIDVEYLIYLLKAKNYINPQHRMLWKDKTTFDSDVYNTVQQYQKRNKLVIDGVVGRKTWKALGVNPKETIVGKVEHVIIHCSGTVENEPKSYAWFKNVHVIGNGWSDIAYGKIYHIDGSVTTTRSNLDYDPFILKSEKTFGTLGENNKAIDICYVGGLDNNLEHKNTLNSKQIPNIINDLMLFIKFNPTVKIAGHNQFKKKGCPCFDTREVLLSWGIPEVNIEMKDLK